MSYELYKSFYEKRDIKDHIDYINYCTRYNQLKAKHKKLWTKDRRSLEWIDVPLRPYRKLPTKKEWNIWVHIPTLSHWYWYMRYAKKMWYIFIDWVKPEAWIDMAYRIFNKENTVIKHWDFMEVWTLDEYKELVKVNYSSHLILSNEDLFYSFPQSTSCSNVTTQTDSETSLSTSNTNENYIQTTNWETSQDELSN